MKINWTFSLVIDPSIDSTLALSVLKCSWLILRFKFEDLRHFSDMDSDKSVSTTKEVMQLIPDGHPTDEAIYLSLGDLLIMLSEHSGTLADWISRVLPERPQ